MGDLFGGGPDITSGSPIETGGASAELGRLFAQMMSGEAGREVGRRTSRSTGESTSITAPGIPEFMQALSSARSEAAMRAMINQLGYDPSTVGIGDAVTRGLASPADQTAGLFAALRPIEEQMMTEQVSGLRTGLGTTGGRFGRTAQRSEGRLRSDLSARNLASREAAILQANSQVNALLAQLFNAQNASAAIDAGLFGDVLSFLRPGEPIVQDDSILPGLLSAGSTLGAAWLMGRNRPGVPETDIPTTTEYNFGSGGGAFQPTFG